MADAGDIRYRLVQQLLREGAKRGAARFHVACADADGNVELFMQAGFIRYGEEHDPVPRRGQPLPDAMDRRSAPRPRDPAGRRRSTRSPLHRLYAAATPQPGPAARGDPPAPTGSARAPTGASRARASPRSCASPTSRPSSRRPPDGGKDGTQLDGVRPGRRREGGPAALSQGHRPGPSADASALIGSAWASSRRARERGGGHRHDHGVIAPVRTYESPIDRRLEEEGFEAIATVTLLMKETLVRVAEPALVPAGVR